MDVKKIAKRGEEIYARRYKENFERNYRGKYMVIDITTEDYSIASTPEEATQEAHKKNPKGVFYLIRIGYSGVYRMRTHLTSADY